MDRYVPVLPDAPLLQSVAANPDSLKRKDVDALGLEITMALRRCSVPESNVVNAEEHVNDVMMHYIKTIDSALQHKSKDSEKAGATFLLVRRVTCTPENLTLLCKIADPTIRTGSCRCHAVWLLNQFRAMEFCWKIRLLDGSGRTFPMALIETMAGVLDARIDPGPHYHRKPNCFCTYCAWKGLENTMLICTGTGPPKGIISMLLKYDWPTILTRPDVLQGAPNLLHSLYGTNMIIFSIIHKAAVRLLEEDEDSRKARKLLKSLGRCSKDLLQKYLTDIVAKTIWVGSEGEGERFYKLTSVVDSMTPLLHCLVPLPGNDAELDSLVERGRAHILELVMNSVDFHASKLAEHALLFATGLRRCKYLLDLMAADQWQSLKHESDEARWIRFKNHYLTSPDSGATDLSTIAKDWRKVIKEETKNSINLSGGEICANCFVQETELRYKLMKCTRCRQIKYCSRTCQVEHWKKAHKSQCSPVKST